MAPVTDAAHDAIELEGMVSTLTVIKVMSADLSQVKQALRAKQATMPDLFETALIAVDLCGIDGHPDEVAAADTQPELAPVTLEAIIGLLRQERFTPVAVRNLRRERVQEAERLGLGRVRSTPPRAKRKPKSTATSATGGPSATGAAGAGSTPAAAAASASEEQAASALLQSPTVMVRQPVRGGQVVYAKAADAIALAPINAGGELIADGNIHVYAPLRGRALAGAHGDERARIFCTCLQAELISVAGVYLHAEELPDSHRGKPAQVYLEGDKLVVTDL